jgi:site-specific DNA-methyltransferase (adenine-specific)
MHSDQQINQIASSIKEFGFTNPVLIDKDSGIIAGHGRVLAAKKLNIEKVPTIELSHLTDAQKKAYILADNKLALNAGWDDDLLSLELINLRELDFDLDLIGFGEDELDQIIQPSVEQHEGKTDPDDVPEVTEKPKTRPGDVWLLGNHRLMCGDSTSIDDIQSLMIGGIADILLTDPPYNVAYKGKTKDALTIQNDEMMDDEFRSFLRDAFVNFSCVMRPGAVFYIWYADLEAYNFYGACFDAGWRVRQCLIWKKHVMVMGRKDYHYKHEPCLYGWKDGAAHMWVADRKQTTILEFDRQLRNAEHPTMKPVDLIEYQILNNTKNGDIVLDGFGGSGTTIIASEKNGRIARVMELDTHYCDVIVNRWQNFTGKEAILESTGETYNSIQV